ncbi:hypothetical protein RB195_008707 [Necator americanus]|uniref:Uncharacterized protein n=1 Tax=Necator americanus TaxID=51031 RepID=A0ABR1CPX5_NECAM
MWWNQLGVINCELLQPNETSTGERHQQKLIQMRISHAPVDDSLPGPEKQLTTHEEVKNWIDSWIASIDEERFRRGIRMLAKTCSKLVANYGQYFE